MSKKGRGKGPGGITIREAVCVVVTRLGRATGDEIFNEVKKIYEWGNHAILRFIMAQTINLQPSYREWSWIKQRDKCLFLCGDGHFEHYDQSKHGIFEDGIKIE
jgi:hypothetical protein